MVLAKPAQVPEATRTVTSWGACILSASCTVARSGSAAPGGRAVRFRKGRAYSVGLLRRQGRNDLASLAGIMSPLTPEGIAPQGRAGPGTGGAKGCIGLPERKG